MPSGVYEHHPHGHHMTKADVRAFVLFCLREDIAKQLENEIRPHILAVTLYERETGIKVSAATAYKQKGRWMMVNGELCEIKKRKDALTTHVIPRKQPKSAKQPEDTKEELETEN